VLDAVPCLSFEIGLGTICRGQHKWRRFIGECLGLNVSTATDCRGTKSGCEMIFPFFENGFQLFLGGFARGHDIAGLAVGAVCRYRVERDERLTVLAVAFS